MFYIQGMENVPKAGMAGLSWPASGPIGKCMCPQKDEHISGVMPGLQEGLSSTTTACLLDPTHGTCTQRRVGRPFKTKLVSSTNEAGGQHRRCQICKYSPTEI